MMYVIYVLLLTTIFHQAMAVSVQCQAMVRNEQDQLHLALVTVDDLVSASFFEGRYFKIVYGASNETIGTQDHRLVNGDAPKGKEVSLATRACTAYYHLSLARKYFVKNFESRRARNVSKLVVRIQMPLRFIDSNHFMHGDFKAYNDSLTIMPSNENKLPHVDAWGTEIWFSPAKEIKLGNDVQKAASYISSPAVQEQLRLGVLTSVGATAAAQYARGVELTSLEGKLYLESLMLSLLVVTVTPFVINKVAGLFKKSFYIDTGLIPEVIYHEFSHVALADNLAPVHNVPLIEGMANFFASEIGQTDAILRRTRGLSKGYDFLIAKRRLVFDSWMEDLKYAHYGFTFHLLWRVKQVIDAIIPDMGAKMIYSAAHLNLLDSSSDLQRDLTNAIESSVRKNIPIEGKQTEVLLALSRLWNDIGF